MPLPSRIFVISDLHLGPVGPLRIFHAGAALARFIRSCAAVLGRVELVILGDALDYLQFTTELAFTAAVGEQKTTEILNANPEVFDALASYMSTPDKSLVWFIGNHDLELIFPSVRAQIVARIGATPTWHLTHTAREYELPGGAKFHLVHGNDPDAFNRVDYTNLAAVAAGGGDPTRVYPIGSRLVDEVLNRLKLKGHGYIDLLKPEVGVALPLALALWPSEVGKWAGIKYIGKGTRQTVIDAIFTAISGPRGSFGRGSGDGRLTDVDPVLTSILATIYAGDPTIGGDAYLDWLDRPRAVAAPAAGGQGTFGAPARVSRALLLGAVRKHSAYDAFDVYGADEFSDKSEYVAADGVVLEVVGHTHLARVRERGGSYYINTGTWADLMRLPTLARVDFDAMVTTLLDHFERPETGPAWLRPFRQLTFVDIALPGGTKWTARLRRWPEDDAITLAACP